MQGQRREKEVQQYAAAQGERQERERGRAKERERLLREREDPYWQQQLSAAIAQLPWRRVRE